MKVVYLSNFDGNLDSGINKKMIGQVKSLKRHFPKTELIYLINANEDKATLGEFRGIEANVPPFRGFMDKVKSLFFFMDDPELLLSIPMDILYLRNPTLPTSIMRKLKKKGVQVVIEIVSNTRQESLIRKSYFNAYVMHYVYQRRLKEADKIVSVTREIFEKCYNINNSDFLELGNGYPFNDNGFVNTNSYSLDQTLNLVCVARFSQWHAIDRLLKGLRNYNGKDKVNVYLVGDGRALAHLKEMTLSYGLESQVFFKGFLSGIELEEVLSKAHVGIANLGIHRKGLTYTSPLKSREYCSMAIPFIYAGIDKDFIDFKYGLRFEADDSPIDIGKILEFALSVSNSNKEQEMRAYALENISYESKIKKLIKFLN